MAKKTGFRGNEMPVYDVSFTSIYRILLLFFAPVVAWTLSLIPPASVLWLAFRYLNLTLFSHLILLCLVLVSAFFVFCFSFVLIPGLFIWLFRIKVREGSYNISIKEWEFFKLGLHALLYRPPLKFIEQFKLLGLRRIMHRLAGAKIGKTTVLPGTELFYDPYVLEIGENCMIGGYVKITGHLADEKMNLKKVKIGNNVLLGAECWIMAGAIIEDDVKIGIRSVVTSKQVLKKGKTYVGCPAKEI